MIPDWAKNEETPDEWYSRIPAIHEIPDGTFIVITDGGYNWAMIAGVGIIIRTKDTEYKPKGHSARCRSPPHAELTSIKKGLQELCRIKREVKRVVAYNDSEWGCCALRGWKTSEKSHIRKVLREIGKLEKKIECPVEYIWVRRTETKRADTVAKRERKAKEKAKDKEIKKRIDKVHAVMRRGEDIEIVVSFGQCYAVSGSDPNREYRVALDPPSCECPGWMNTYGNLPREAILARALPCKHMCALAKYQGIDIRDQFGRQIFRRD